MKKNYSVKVVLLPCILLIMVFSLCGCVTPGTTAQTGQTAQAAKPPAFTPPPDQMIYFKCGRRETTVNVQATNANVPGIGRNLTYLKYTDTALGAIGYDMIDNPAKAAIKVRTTVNYNQVDNSQAVANEMGNKMAAGAMLGVLSALAGGGSGRDAAQGAAGGAADGLASGTTRPPVLKYLTFEFEISSKAAGTQTGRITKDITDNQLTMEEFIDGAIGDYLDAALPQK